MNIFLRHICKLVFVDQLFCTDQFLTKSLNVFSPVVNNLSKCFIPSKYSIYSSDQEKCPGLIFHTNDFIGTVFPLWKKKETSVIKLSPSYNNNNLTKTVHLCD